MTYTERTDTLMYNFEEQVHLFPEKAAVIHGTQRLTYFELNSRADEIARRLIELGAVKGRSVLLAGRRSPETIAAILGILKAGCIYVPAEPDWPQSRIQYLILDARPFAAVTDDTDCCNHLDIPVLNLKNVPHTENTGQSVPMPPSSGSACIIYTSGTTGKPKGTLLPQEGILRLIKPVGVIPLNPDTVMLQTGALSFDAAVFEIWGCLLNGGTLCLPAPGILTIPDALRNEIKKYQVNTLWLTSALFNHIINENPHTFDNLDYLLTGGEEISLTHVKRLRNVNKDTRLFNCYGPTENTIFTTVFEIGQVCPDIIPIGKEVAGTKVYILNGMTACDKEEEGELCTVGIGVSAGYLNQPAMTEDKYIDNPFGPGKLYRTGDLARRLPDGNILFCGRMDEQVKINGYRIEPEEIREVLNGMKDIREAVCIVGRDLNGNNKLAAFYTCAAAVEPQTIKRRLQQELPEYMLPSSVIRIDSIPMTKNGKIDKKALLMHLAGQPDRAIPLSDPVEQTVGELFMDALGISVPPEPEDSFFEMGGSSIAAAALVLSIQSGLHVRLALKDIFLYPSIRRLSLLIKEKTACAETRKKTPDRNCSEPENIARFQVSDLQTQKNLLNDQQREYEACLLKKKERSAPLSPIQLISIQSGIKVSGLIMEFNGYLDWDRLNQVWNMLVKQYDVLRSTLSVLPDEMCMNIYEIPQKTVIPYLDITYMSETPKGELLKELTDRRKIYYENEMYLGNRLSHEIVMVKTDEEHYTLILSCSHLVFDGYSADLLENRIRELYESASAVPELPDRYFRYENYTRKIEAALMQAKESDIMSALNLKEFTDSLESYKQYLEKEEVVCFRYSFRFPEQEALPEADKLSRIQYAYDQALRLAFPTQRVPFFVIVNGREYKDFTFYEDMGELIDAMPFVFDAHKEGSLFHNIRQELSRMKQFHIHYVSLMMSQKPGELFPAVMEQIIKTAALNVSIPIFNYLLLYQDQLPDHDENTPETENGDEMNVSSIACCGTLADLYLLCPKNKADTVRKRLDSLLLKK